MWKEREFPRGKGLHVRNYCRRGPGSKEWRGRIRGGGKARQSSSDGGCSRVLRCQLHLTSPILKQRSCVVITLTHLRHWLLATPPLKYTGISRSLLGDVSSHSLKTLFPKNNCRGSLDGKSHASLWELGEAHLETIKKWVPGDLHAL